MPYTFFFTEKSPFSQWYACTFVVDGVTFNCAEQFMMHGKAKLFAESLFNEEGEILALHLMDLVRAGNRAAIMFCAERLLPVQRHPGVQFNLPSVESAADAVKASAAVLSACAGGELSIRGAQDFMTMLARQVRLIESCEIEQRIDSLEKQQRS